MNGHRPAGFKLPQIIAEATAHHGTRGWILAFDLPPILRLLKLTCIVSIPDNLREGAHSPVYVRFFLDRVASDKPGSVVVEDEG